MQIQSIAVAMGQKAHIRKTHEQGLKTNQGAAAAKTMMTHSLNKEASQVLCDAIRCRVEDGDAEAEDWTDSKGNSLRPDRFWNDGLETLIAADGEGDCMGIELNIWERAKVRIPFSFRMYIMVIMFIIHIMRLPNRYVDTLCTHWLAAETSMGDFNALDYRKIRHGDDGKLGNYPILAFLPDKMARFLYEFHAFRFESLGLLPLPAD